MGKTRVTFLQPSQNRAISSPVIVPDDELEDERPLTLAEKAKIHKTQPAPAPQAPAPMAPAQRQPPPPPGPPSAAPRAAAPQAAPQAAPPAPAAAPAQHFAEAPEPSWAEADSKTELMSPAFKRNAGPEDISEIPLSAPSLAMAEAHTPAGLDDAIINGSDHMESEADSSLTHAATMHSTHEQEVGLELESASAVIEIKNGAKSGQVLPIDKPVTTLGRPGIQIAAIMKKPEGYFLMHIESDENVEPPQLNQSSIGDEPVLLKSGDALNVAGIDVQFMQS